MNPIHAAGGKDFAIRQIGAVEQVRVTVEPDESLRRLGWSETAATEVFSLPAQFHQGAGWRLTHAVPSTGEIIEWNWDNKPLFREGGIMSTYKLRDENLLRSIAAVFSQLAYVRHESPMGEYDEYVVAPAATDAIVPNLHFYANPTRTARFLALYNQPYLSQKEQETGALSKASVYEIVEVEIDNEAEFIRQIGRAQQAAMRYSRVIFG